MLLLTATPSLPNRSASWGRCPRHPRTTRQSATADPRRPGAVLDNAQNNGLRLQKLRGLYQHWKDCNDRLQSLDNDGERERRREYLSFVLREYETLKPQENEYETLMTERKQLSTDQSLVETVTSCSKIRKTSENASLRKITSFTTPFNHLRWSQHGFTKYCGAAAKHRCRTRRNRGRARIFSTTSTPRS